MATQLTGDGVEVSLQPRSYGVSPGWKLLLVTLGLLFGPGGIAALVFLVFLAPHGANEPIWLTLFLSAIAAGFAALGFYTALSALIYRVVLTADGVEVIEPFRRRQLLCREMSGRRMLRPQQGPPILVLVPKDETAKKLKISLMLKKDPAFDAWLAQLPDLDQEELDRSEREVAEALYQDQMPDERSAHITRLKQLAKWINGATIAVAIAAFALPDNHHLATATLIALPWVAVWLVARFQPLYRFGARRNDAHPDLTAPLIVPGLLLAARALTDAHTFDWSGPLMLAFSGGLALSCAALRVDPWFRQQRWTAILTCIFLFAYGLGAGLEIDVLADSITPSVYRAQVLGKRVSRGSKSSTYYLRVGPWGPIAAADEISVPAARYATTRTGDTVCIYVGKGALRVPWYQLRDCPEYPE
jgi:hypothetical protein